MADPNDPKTDDVAAALKSMREDIVGDIRTALATGEESRRAFLLQMKEDIREWDRTRFAIVGVILTVAGVVGIRSYVDYLFAGATAKAKEATIEAQEAEELAKTSAQRIERVLSETENKLNERLVLTANRMNEIDTRVTEREERFTNLIRDFEEQERKLRAKLDDLVRTQEELVEAETRANDQFDRLTELRQQLDEIRQQAELLDKAPKSETQTAALAPPEGDCETAPLAVLLGAPEPQALGCGRLLPQAGKDTFYRLKGQEYEIDPLILRTVVRVETLERFFDESGRTAIQFFPHVFHRLLGPGPARDRAVEEGLASERFGEIDPPRSRSARLAQLMDAMQIDQDAALQATSWVGNTILGETWVAEGLGDAADLARIAVTSEADQIEALLRTLEAGGNLGYLRREDWHGFFRSFNGPGYMQYDYVERAAAEYAQLQAVKSPRAAGDIKPSEIAEMQEVLSNLGLYDGAIDGVVGPMMLDAIRRFQIARGLGDADGVITTETVTSLGLRDGGNRESPVAAVD
ncbi:MAG: N-acetylmuramidase domain-containing protein [Pseudomonadota bacterium]